MSAHAVSLPVRYRHRARHAAPVARWPYRNTLALVVAVFVVSSVVSLATMALQARPAGYARPLTQITWTNATQGVADR